MITILFINYAKTCIYKNCPILNPKSWKQQDGKSILKLLTKFYLGKNNKKRNKMRLSYSVVNKCSNCNNHECNYDNCCIFNDINQETAD